MPECAVCGDRDASYAARVVIGGQSLGHVCDKCEVRVARALENVAMTTRRKRGNERSGEHPWTRWVFGIRARHGRRR